MRRCLLVLCFLLIFIPHLIPLPESAGDDTPDNRTRLAQFGDDGQKLPTAEQMAKLAAEEPIAFLENCLRRNEREVQGFQLVLLKQERIDNNLEKKEVIDVWFKVKPHSVFLKWREGARRAWKVLYVEGENQVDGKSMLIAKPHGPFTSFINSIVIDPNSRNAKSSGRYPLPEFGMKKGLLRTLASWEQAKKEGGLFVQYEGIQKIPELGGRTCYVLRRSRYKEPEGPDKVTEQVLFVDLEHWLLVGTVLKHRDDQNVDHLVASYFFRDIQLNPKFAEDQFTKKRIEEKER